MPATHKPVVSKDTPAPIMDPQNEGKTGYGPLKDEPLTTMYGFDVKEANTFTESTPQLARNSWYNYQLKGCLPPPISNSQQNLRMWQDLEIERLLDHTPTHEVHPQKLPDYHFWPMIQNENSPKPKVITPVMAEYHGDQSHLPRFSKLGIPKTPPQEQDFYLPLKPNGRFDWRRNIAANGYTASLFSRLGWEKRYLVNVGASEQPPLLSGFKIMSNFPIHFRQAELPWTQRITRAFSASHLDRTFIFITLYCALLLSASASGAHCYVLFSSSFSSFFLLMYATKVCCALSLDITDRNLNWNNESWNYDIKFMHYQRNKGGFHGVSENDWQMNFLNLKSMIRHHFLKFFTNHQ
ncbi:hypothetical protein RFI_32644 [Reticulomyxa filosa]|uniref:Uncharacterized protein n=1 Tax=Reticulomyxa filosa TaxID=46433 RepID=X6LS83_RETFI|nr:hypothetical protein RFI_32644 [Reticulomyxa filosa]|eukprot:ETO04753.1 hypothetical protein RFI_32644 [Reticulomyxa filosa]